jgi:hypothetical protein
MPDHETRANAVAASSQERGRGCSMLEYSQRVKFQSVNLDLPFEPNRLPIASRSCLVGEVAATTFRKRAEDFSRPVSYDLLLTINFPGVLVTRRPFIARKEGS